MKRIINLIYLETRTIHPSHLTECLSSALETVLNILYLKHNIIPVLKHAAFKLKKETALYCELAA